MIVGSGDLFSLNTISKLYVHPDHTHRGIGKTLPAEMERDARASDVLWLTAHANLICEPLLLREGFAVVDRRTVTMGHEPLEIAVMKKVLEPSA